MPKLSRDTRFVILLVLVFVVFMAGFWFLRGKQGEAEAARLNLENQLLVMNNSLRQPAVSRTAELEASVRAAEREKTLAMSPFPVQNDNLSLIQGILDLAKSTSVKVTGMNASMVTSKVNNVDYPALKIDLKLSGKITYLHTFIIQLGEKLATSESSQFTLNKSASSQVPDTAEVILLIYLRRPS